MKNNHPKRGNLLRLRDGVAFLSIVLLINVGGVMAFSSQQLPPPQPGVQVAPPSPPNSQPNQLPVSNQDITLTPEAMDTLMGPIALYPDALIGLILPASTVPSDIVLATRYLQDGGDASAVANQLWDESVKGLAHYPTVLNWMNTNLEWTTDVGQVFIAQPAEVMNAIQRLRAKAKEQGNLVDNAQQKVLVEEQNIRIIPAEAEVIYVPGYDPRAVYYQSYSPDYGPLVTFGLGFAVGSWLSYDFDWGHRNFYCGNWRGWNHNGWRGNGWNGNGGGNNVTINNNNVNVVNISNATTWQPSANAARQFQANTNSGRAARMNARAAALHTGTAGNGNAAHAYRSGRSFQNGQPQIDNTAPRARNAGAGNSSAGQMERNFHGQGNRNSLTARTFSSAPVVGSISNASDGGRANHGYRQHIATPTAAPNVEGQMGVSQNNRSTFNGNNHSAHSAPQEMYHRSVPTTVAPSVSGQQRQSHFFESNSNARQHHDSSQNNRNRQNGASSAQQIQHSSLEHATTHGNRSNGQQHHQRSQESNAAPQRIFQPQMSQQVARPTGGATGSHGDGHHGNGQKREKKDNN